MDLSVFLGMFFVVICSFKFLAGPQSIGDSYLKGSMNGMNQLIK